MHSRLNFQKSNTLASRISLTIHWRNDAWRRTQDWNIKEKKGKNILVYCQFHQTYLNTVWRRKTIQSKKSIHLTLFSGLVSCNDNTVNITLNMLRFNKNFISHIKYKLFLYIELSSVFFLIFYIHVMCKSSHQ